MTERNNLLLETIQRLIRRNAKNSIKKILDKTHPADIAEVFYGLIPNEQIEILKLIDDYEKSSLVISELSGEIKQTLLSLLFEKDKDFLISILEKMEPDDLADTISELPEELSQSILKNLKKEEKEDIQELLAYGEDTAGRLMSTNYFAMNENSTVGEAIEYLRKSENVDMAFYLYVINDKGHLVGVVSLRQLVISPPDTILKDIMIHDVISVNVNQDQEEVANIVARYNILAVPVVDDSNKLLGIITVDDVIDVFKEEATEDFLRIAGTVDATIEKKSFFTKSFARIPTVFIVFVLSVVSYFILKGFVGGTTSQHSFKLILYLPFVLFFSSTIGFQSSIVVARVISLNSAKKYMEKHFILRELLVALSLSFLFLVLCAGFVLLVNNFSMAGLKDTMWLSMLIIIGGLVSSLLGGTSPFVLNKLNLDPFLLSGILMSSLLSVFAILIHFVLGNVLIGFLY